MTLLGKLATLSLLLSCICSTNADENPLLHANLLTHGTFRRPYASPEVRNELHKFRRHFVFNYKTRTFLSYIEPKSVDKTKPLVVMIHGFPESPYHYGYQMNKLAHDGYWPIAVHLRGWSYTWIPRPLKPEDLSIDTLSGDIKAVIESVGRSEAVLFAHDFGTALGLATCLEYPEMVRGVMMISIPAGPLPANAAEVQAAQQAREAQAKQLEAAGLEIYSQYMVSDRSITEFNSNPYGWMSGLLNINFTVVKAAGTPLFTPELLASFKAPSFMTEAEFEREVYLMRKSGLENPTTSYSALGVAQMRQRTDVIQMPYAFIMGENDPLRPGFEARFPLLPNLPGYRFHRFIEDASHFMLLEKPEVVYQNMKEFLDILEA